MSEPLRILERTTAFAVAALAALAMSGEAAAADTGGQAYGNNTPAPAAETPAHYADTGPCPTPEKLTRRNLSAGCREFVMSKLRGSVYDDVSDTVAVIAYERKASISVDGILGPDVARHVLRRKALEPASPDPSSRGKELFIDKSEQLAYDLRGGRIKHVFAIASGTERHYRQMGTDGLIHEGNGHTHTGTFRINSVEGPNYSSGLGSMPNARFYYGHLEAVHAGSVTRRSHACVHVDPPTMDSYIVPAYGMGDTVKIGA